jgi:AcrR family transcriptional regulator
MTAREQQGVRADQIERRPRIIRAATELLEESEVEKIQIRDVADRAGAQR